MVRRLRLLLATVLLALCLVVTAEGAAVAAPGYGPAVPGDTVTLSEADGADVQDGLLVTCALSGQWAVDWASGPGAGSDVARSVNYKASCSTGWNISHVDLSVTLSGENCELSAHPGEMDGTGTVSGVAGAVGVDGCTGPSTETATITTWCASAVIDTHAGVGLDTSFTAEACGDLPMGTAPNPDLPSSCIFGAPTKPVVGGEMWSNYSSSKRAKVRTVTFSVASGTTPDPSGAWYGYIVTDNSGGGGGNPNSNPGNTDVTYSGETYSGGATSNPFANPTPPAPTVILEPTAKRVGTYLTKTLGGQGVDSLGVPFSRWRHATLTHSGTDAEIAAGNYTANPIIGAGLFRVNTSGSNPGTGVTNTGNMSVSGSDRPTGSTVMTEGLVGKHIPAACVFYWGEAIYSHPDNTYDTPGGTLEPGLPSDPDPIPDPDPGDPEPRNCDFSWTDPLTWATGGICEVVRQLMKAVGYLKSIAAAVVGLAAAIGSAIAGAIEDALTALFVPDADFLDDVTEDASAMLDESDVGEYRDAALTVTGDGASSASVASPFTWSFPGASLAAGSGCAGPSITWSMVSPDAFSPLAACSAPMSTVAGYFRSFALLLIAFGGLFRGLGIVTASMGLTKTEKPAFEVKGMDKF